MTSDLVKRLRSQFTGWLRIDELSEEAADRIEALERALRGLTDLLDAVPHRDGTHLRLHEGHPIYDRARALVPAPPQEAK